MWTNCEYIVSFSPRGAGCLLPKRDKTADVAVAVAVKGDDHSASGEQPPWKGSWAKDGGGGWAIRLWMPDNDHREGEPREGDKVRITTKAGKVQALRLGERLGSSRRSMLFAAPARGESTRFAAPVRGAPAPARSEKGAQKRRPSVGAGLAGLLGG